MPEIHGLRRLNRSALAGARVGSNPEIQSFSRLMRTRLQDLQIVPAWKSNHGRQHQMHMKDLNFKFLCSAATKSFSKIAPLLLTALGLLNPVWAQVSEEAWGQGKSAGFPEWFQQLTTGELMIRGKSCNCWDGRLPSPLLANSCDSKVVQSIDGFPVQLMRRFAASPDFFQETPIGTLRVSLATDYSFEEGRWPRRWGSMVSKSTSAKYVFSRVSLNSNAEMQTRDSIVHYEHGNEESRQTQSVGFRSISGEIHVFVRDEFRFNRPMSLTERDVMIQCALGREI